MKRIISVLLLLLAIFLPGRRARQMGAKRAAKAFGPCARSRVTRC